MCQKPKEDVQQFLLRSMDARNRVIFASKEADTDFSYGGSLIQGTFLKALETGFRDEHLNKLSLTEKLSARNAKVSSVEGAKGKTARDILRSQGKTGPPCRNKGD